jgi:3-isopropylmalate/(R)-2-methylmalate dehydratase small subunit
MRPLREVRGLACALPFENIDTDQLTPARFMKTPRSAGYGQFLLYDLRRDSSGVPRADLALNRADPGSVRVLVTRRNFGVGSSREAAVYALVDAGIEVVVAPAFGDIFAANAVNNRLLTAVLDEADCESLLARLGRQLLLASLDLETQCLHCAGLSLRFGIDPVARLRLLNGWDDIDLTARRGAAIADFVRRDRRARPWAQPQSTDLPRPSDNP